jgi:ATP-binding cassette subfamily B protein
MKKYPKTGIISALLYVVGAVLVANVLPLMYKAIVDIASANERSAQIAAELTEIIGMFIAIILAIQISFRAADFTIVYFQSNVLRDFAYQTFWHIHQHSYLFFSNNFSGALVTKAKRYLRSFETIHDRVIFSFLWSGAQVIGALAVMAFFVPAIAFAYSVWVIFYVALVLWFVRWKTPYDIIEAEADSDVTARYADTVTNALAIKMFASFGREKRAFRETVQEEEKKRRKAWNIHIIQIAINGFLFALLEIGIMSYAVYLWYQGEITVGTIVLLQAYVLATFNAMFQLGRAITETTKALADAKEMVEIFEEKPEVRDPEKPEVCRIREGKIEFRDVAFSYEKDQTDVFENFSLTIIPGEKIGLVGESGAGKTTITKILLRFSDISKGSVMIDGQDIRAIRQDDLRLAISYVPQEPVLFHRSLRENIAYGKSDASEEEIVEAAKRAHAHEFITKLPKGYETLVGERGVKLSGGERQRVAIARAMLKNAPILILDEATSSLDSISERHIQDALDELMRGKTTIVVAHRLSTIQKMDRILVMRNGKVVEEGVHSDLISRNGVYAKFWNEQAGGFLGE